MTQRDGMGREVGGGFRMGNTCTPVADSCWCMAKPIQYCKVKQIAFVHNSVHHVDCRRKEMTNHSSILTWIIPCTEEPGRLVNGVTKSWT